MTITTSKIIDILFIIFLLAFYPFWYFFGRPEINIPKNCDAEMAKQAQAIENDLNYQLANLYFLNKDLVFSFGTTTAIFVPDTKCEQSINKL